MIDYDVVDVFDKGVMDKVKKDYPDILNTECKAYPAKGQEIQIKLTKEQILFFNMEEYDKDIDQVSKLFLEKAKALYHYLPLQTLHIIGFYDGKNYNVVDIAGIGFIGGFKYYTPAIIDKVMAHERMQIHQAIKETTEKLGKIIKSEEYGGCIIKPFEYNIMVDEEEKLTFRKG